MTNQSFLRFKIEQFKINFDTMIKMIDFKQPMYYYF